jgi:hypothetical protein
MKRIVFKWFIFLAPGGTKTQKICIDYLPVGRFGDDGIFTLNL